MKRRDFIVNTSITALGFLALSRCARNMDSELVNAALELIKDPEGYLDLPSGFSYQIISKSGDAMSDGFVVPARPDGMGAFPGDQQQVILVINHENSPGSASDGPFGTDNEKLNQIALESIYDNGGGSNPSLGGTTTLIYDEAKGEVVKQYLSLIGTNRNCAGGVTPWNSWLTCEEDVTKADGNESDKDHGYVFDVPANSSGISSPQPIKGMGRFNHEAVAVDPATHVVYQTEDRHDGLLYRYVPIDKNDLHAGGQLQVLAIKGLTSLDTRNWNDKKVALNQKLTVEWLNIDDVESPNDDLRQRGFEMGAARFARGEGMWYGHGEIYFACTNGGPNRLGQIFKYDIANSSLELFIESEDKTLLHMCDNLTISPKGLVFVCEDNSQLNRIHMINSEGQVRCFAINQSSSSELAGAVFSPSGKTLFVNIQENGETVAITGPWDTLG